MTTIDHLRFASIVIRHVSDKRFEGRGIDTLKLERERYAAVFFADYRLNYYCLAYFNIICIFIYVNSVSLNHTASGKD